MKISAGAVLMGCVYVLLVAAPSASAVAAHAAGVRASASVVIPAVTDTSDGLGRGDQSTLPAAYDRLHAAGLRVRYRLAYSLGSFICPPTVARQSPPAGRRVKRGTFVTLTTKPPRCAVESPGVPIPVPSADVPSFTGRQLSTVQSWAEAHNLYWQAVRLPALPAGHAATLLDNYRVVRQAPDPGTLLTLGDVSTPGVFRPTPLTVSARLIR
jgi:beta-lactam-binding protein with PASTA domain